MRKKALPQFELRHRMSLALEYAGVSVSEMAAELGASRSTVSNYLHGRTKPGRAHLIVWALKCGVPFEWIVNGENIPNGDAKGAATTGRKAATR
jgi:transcriptional regulator with XRE-family HTH domain